MAWMQALWDSRQGRISIQVLQEYYVTVTAKLDPGLRQDEARADVWRLGAWNPLPIERALLEDAWQVEDRTGLSFSCRLSIHAMNDYHTSHE